MLILTSLIIALVSIISTILPADIQAHSIIGIPLMLWMWLINAAIICVCTLVYGFKALKHKEHELS